MLALFWLSWFGASAFANLDVDAVLVVLGVRAGDDSLVVSFVVVYIAAVVVVAAVCWLLGLGIVVVIAVVVAVGAQVVDIDANEVAGAAAVGLVHAMF